MSETRRKSSITPQSGLRKCHLCGAGPLTHCSRPAAWPEETQQWVNTLCTTPIPPGAVVCRACEKYIKRHTGEKNVNPRWCQTESVKPKFCMVEGCGEVSHTSTCMVTIDIVQGYLDIHAGNVNNDSELSLCSSHYQHLYREVHYPEPCAACLSQPKYGDGYKPRCPDLVKITEFLKQTLDYRNELTPTSKICKPCYLFHRQVLLSSNCTVADTLGSVASDQEARIKQFDMEDTYSVHEKSFLDWSIWKMSLHLVKILQNEEAILLPELFAMFQQHTVESVDRFPHVTKSLKTNLPTIRWFLSSISNHLGSELGITCKHKKYEH